MIDKNDRSQAQPTSPFKVPDDYFDCLADRVMSRIPANEVRMVDVKAPVRHTRWYRYAAAASIVAAIFGAGLFFGHHTSDQTDLKAQAKVEAHTSATSTGASYDAEFDNVADYIMCDDYDLYAYLASE